jgi:ABC-type sugar transport system permease subunit
VRLAFYKSDFLFDFTNYVGLQNFKDLFHDNDFLDVSHVPAAGALINNLRG